MGEAPTFALRKQAQEMGEYVETSGIWTEADEARAVCTELADEIERLEAGGYRITDAQLEALERDVLNPADSALALLKGPLPAMLKVGSARECFASIVSRGERLVREIKGEV